MNHDAIKTAVRAAVCATLDLDPSEPAQVVWLDEFEASYARPFPYVDLSSDNVQTLGVDETRYYRPDDRDEIDAKQTGIRTFEVSVQITSDTAKGNGGALALCDKVKLRLRRAGTLAILQGAGIAVASFTGSRRVDFGQDHRMYSGALFEVVLSYAENDDRDPSPEAGEYFNRVEISPQV